jgi:hypothetical protein
VPSNWRELPGTNAVTFAPDGAYGTVGGRSVFTHGMEIGVSPNDTRDVRTATNELIASLTRGNPNLGQPSRYERVKIGGRQGLQTVMSNTSDATGQREHIAVFAVLLSDDSLFHAIGVAPQDRSNDYTRTFREVVRSIQIME